MLLHLLPSMVSARPFSPCGNVWSVSDPPVVRAGAIVVRAGAVSDPPVGTAL